MARQRLSALPSRDLAVPTPSAASATGPVAVDRHVAEVLPYRRPNRSTQDSDFQSFAVKVAELAKILTGARGSAIAFRGEQGTICWVRSGEGAPPLGALVDSGISKQCLDSGTSLCCEDIATDGRVDPDISPAVGIRAVAVVPIYKNGDISGILEVFSNAPGVFTDQHLKTLQHLADIIGSAANMPSEAPIGVSNMVSPRSPARSPGSSSQTLGWNDVLVDSHVPWRRFIESVLLHILVVGMLSGLSRIWPPELLLSPPSLREAHVVYYPLSQSFPAHASSRPVQPNRQDSAAHQKIISAGRNREPLLASGIHGTDDAQKVRALSTPPAMPKVASSRFPKLKLGTAVLPPPPDIGGVQARQSHLPDLSVVSPPPTLSGGSGLRKMSPPRTAVVPPSPAVHSSIKSTRVTDTAHLGVGSVRAADISIVPPPPSLNDRAAFTYGARGVISDTGVQVVAPPSSVQDRANLDARAGAVLPGGGVSQVVPPPPSLDGAGNSLGEGRTNSLAEGGSQVVPPAPSMQNGGDSGGGGRTSSLGQADSQVVPPPPSVQLGAGGNSGAGGRANQLAGALAEGVSPPASTQGEENSKLDGEKVEKNVATSSVPEAGGDLKHPIFQDVELRVISLTWAPPRSSYFSNFEVFIAEKWLNTKAKESEIIKLVYEFLPYQQRLSEYRYNDLKVHRVRAVRDSTCDESLMQMAWPEGDKGPAGSDHSRDATASIAADRNNALPCYRITADDYRRAVSRSR
jgi:hypothetical protein